MKIEVMQNNLALNSISRDQGPLDGYPILQPHGQNQCQGVPSPKTLNSDENVK